jgi:hypothetical protein
MSQASPSTDAPAGLPDAIAEDSLYERAGGFLSRLAMELASELTPLPDILRNYNLTRTQLKSLLATQTFRDMFSEAKQIWRSGSNVRQRVRLKAALLAEDSLLEIFRVVHDATANTASRLQAFKQIADLTDIAPRKDGSGPSADGFSIRIVFPNMPTQTVAAGPATIEHDPADATS